VEGRTTGQALTIEPVLLEFWGIDQDLAAPTASCLGGRGERPARHRERADGRESANACGPCVVRQTHGHGGTRVWAEQSSAGLSPLRAPGFAEDAWRMVSGVPDPECAQTLALWVCAEHGLTRGMSPACACTGPFEDVRPCDAQRRGSPKRCARPFGSRAACCIKSPRGACFNSRTGS
jgi:hypothetical protein